MKIEEKIINNLNLELSNLKLNSLWDKQRKEIIIKIKEDIEKNGLYDTLLNSKNNVLEFVSLPLEELIKYEVPKKAYIDSLRFNKINNNYVSSINKHFSFIKLYTIFPELDELLKNASVEQMDHFLDLNYSKMIKNENFYNLIVNKLKQDIRFIKFLPIDNKLINLGLLKQRINYSKFRFSDVEEEMIKQIIPLLNEKNVRNIRSLDYDFFHIENKEIQEIILKNDFLFQELLMNSSWLNKLDENLWNIVLDKVELLLNFPYDKKINIVKNSSSKVQTKLIENFDIFDNFQVLNTWEKKKIFDSIFDKTFLTDCVLNKKIYLKLDEECLIFLVGKLGKENQYKFFNDLDFQEFIKKEYSKKIDNLKQLIYSCDLEIVKLFLTKLTIIYPEDYYNLWCMEPTKNNINLLKKSLVDNPKNNNVIKEILDPQKDLLYKLDEEDFQYFYGLMDTINITTLPYKESIDINNERVRKVVNKIIDKFLEKIDLNNERKYYLNDNLLNYLNEEQAKVYFKHIKINDLFEYILKDDRILDYFIELYKSNPMEFEEFESYKSIDNIIKIKDSNIDKLINFFEILPQNLKIKLFVPELLRNDKIREFLKKDFKLNYKSYLDINILNLNNPECLIMFVILSNLTFEKNECKNIYLNMDISLFCNLISRVSPDNEVIKEVVLERKQEILNNIKSLILVSALIDNLLKYGLSLKDILPYLKPTNICSLYNDSSIRNTKYQNELILFIKQNPKILLENKKIKEFLRILNYNDILSITEKMDINDMMDLFNKSKNVYLESRVMQEFNKNPFFKKTSIYSLSEILFYFKPNNASIISNKINEQYDSLTLSQNFKNKIKNITLDDKLFMDTLFNYNLASNEILEYLENILNKDPFALRNLNVSLFEQEIFNVSKDIIPYIYRYKELTNNYLSLIRNNNENGKLLINLMHLWKKNNNDDKLIISKLNLFINLLNLLGNENLNKLNININNDNDINRFEKYFLSKYNVTVFFGKHFPLEDYLKFDLIKEDLEQKEQKKSLKILNDFNSNNIDEKKNALLEIMFGISLELSIKLVKQFEFSINKIQLNLNSYDSCNLFYFLKVINETDDVSLINALYNKFKDKYDIDDLLNIKYDFEQAYNKSISKDMNGFENGKNIKLKIKDELVDVIEVEDNFNFFAHSTDAYGSMELINNNYFDSWNYSERTSNDGICCAYLSSKNLGTANVGGKGVMFGFININENSISSMAPYDLTSINDDIQVKSYKDPIFMTIEDLTDTIRHTHSETIIKRRTNQGKYPLIQPDCIIIYEEMDEKIKENSIKSQKDFKEHGIDLPIIYINREKIVNNQGNKINKMLDEYEKTFDLKLLSNIINLYESVKCGLKFDENIEPEQLLHKDIIYKNLLSTITKIKNDDNIILGKEFINIIEKEQYKFDLLNGLDGVRKNQFDLLDENMINNINLLKEFINKEMVK